MQAWEVFYAAWERRLSDADAVPSTRAGAAYTKMAEAISYAGAETVRHLRDDGGWSLLNAHLLVARLVDAASDWLLRDGGDARGLRLQLRAAAVEQDRIEVEESEWRRVTEAVLAGAHPHVEQSVAAA
jgi:hypothetical protein